MAEGMTCYERDETFCEDQMCLRVGCRLQNERLSAESKMPARIWAWGGPGSGWNDQMILNEVRATGYIRADLVEPLVEALRIIAGQQQCIDNLMSNADVANAALSSWEAGQ